MWVHMNGVVEMVRSQGGLGRIQDKLLKQILVLYVYLFANITWLLIGIELITN